MSATGLAVFDKTLQETNAWLKVMMHELGTDDRERAYGALKAALHALRARIGPENAAHLRAQLPLLVRGAYYEGWHMAGTPTRERHVQDFLEHLRHQLPKGLTVDPEQTARATFAALRQRLDPGELNKLAKSFHRSCASRGRRLRRASNAAIRWTLSLALRHLVPSNSTIRLYGW
jgi:uncharacterized protein (DUF2267 family)